MDSLPFSQLDKTQRAQVAYLFADEHFGKDASAYVYELEDGNVRGRRKDEGEGMKVNTRRNPQMNVIAIQEVNLTDAILAHAEMSMDALAASIAKKMYQSNTQKVEAIK